MVPEQVTTSRISPLGWWIGLDEERRRILVAYSMVLVLIVLGTWTVSPEFASTEFLMLQLLKASILGTVVAGQMIVILTGNIDLSVSWTMNLAAVLATSIALGLDERLWVGVVIGLGFGLLVGLANGFLVAYLRIPSMVCTLGVNALLKGILVFYTGTQPLYGNASPILNTLSHHFIGGVFPAVALIWLAVSIFMIVLLSRTTFGRATYAVGNNPIATYLSGINVRHALLGVYLVSGVFNALAGILLAGYSGRSFNEMGEPFQFPAIAAVVVGGVSILGGSGHYLGAVAGVLIITLLDSGLSIMQMSPAGRLVIYGLVVLMMLLVYGRGSKMRA
ncbi:Fructose import permease protein FrcC [Anaerolineae bacterium]|nr:Fructose import permease protein FrcC [Anaerolineae bacterium]